MNPRAEMALIVFMATIFSAPARHADRSFFTAMGIAVATLVFAGFARTYYLASWWPQPERAPEMTATLHLHAAAFTLWILLQAAQPALVAADRRDLHRTLGWAGAGLAAAVWILGNLAAAEAMDGGFRTLGDPRAFYAVTFFSIQAFALIVLLGILRRGDADTHKRLMLLSSASILEAAAGRLPFPIVAETAPLSFYLGADWVILAGIVYDRASRGRIHAVWLWGGGLLVLSQILRVAVMFTAPWLAFAQWVDGLG